MFGSDWHFLHKPRKLWKNDARWIKKGYLCVIWIHYKVVSGTCIVNSPTSNTAFLMDWAQMADLDFGLIHQKDFIPLLRVPSFFKNGKLWSNSYIYRRRITSNWLYSQQFSFLTKIQNCISEKTRKKIVLLSFKKFVKTQFLGVV